MAFPIFPVVEKADMFPTAEVRWFYEGTVPLEVLDWFHQGELMPIVQPHRLDYYLAHTDDSLGIKLREGMIEIKQRHRGYGMIRLHDRVSGVVEHWRKWGFKLADLDGNFPWIATADSSWIGVHKDRKVRQYLVDHNRQVVALPSIGYPEQGCNLELTAISIKGETWWSLCFESFGDEDTICETLTQVAKYTLVATKPPLLDNKHTFSYPKWLELVLGSNR